MAGQKISVSPPQSMRHVLLKRESEHTLCALLMMIDFCVALIAAKVAYYLRHGMVHFETEYVILAAIGALCFVGAQYVCGRYCPVHLFSFGKHLVISSAGALLTIGTSALLLFFLKSGALISRMWMGEWGVLIFLFSILGYAALIGGCTYLFRRGAFRRRVVLVGNAAQMLALKAHCDENHMLVEAIYITMGELPKSAASLWKLTQCTTPKELLQVVLMSHVDDVLLTARFGKSQKQENDVLSMLRRLPVAVRYCLHSVFSGKGMYVAEKWNGLPMVTLYRKPVLRHQVVFKRVIDIVGALFALIIFGIPMLVVGLIVKWTSPGPIFFTQERGGFGGAYISVVKFRSMTTMDSGQAEVRQATKGDVRITPIGKVIRKFNLDELPQLINVIKGEMSLVGPRPHAVSHDDAYASLIDSYAARHRMKPGITGWAQVNGLRGETDTLDKMEARVEHDLYYIENWSIWLDLKILAMTPITFFQKTAY